MRGFPGLKKRGRKWWIDVRVRGRRYREPLHTANFEVAKKRWKKRREEIELGEVVDQKSALEWLDLYMRDLGGTTKSSHNREIDRINRDFIGDTNVERVGDLDGTAAVEWLLDYDARYSKHGSISARSRKKYAQHLSQFGHYLVKHKKRSGVRENPFEEVEFTCTDEDRVYVRRHYKLDELQALLSVCPTYRAVVYLAAAFTGLRRSELGKLRWGDVNLDDLTPMGTGWVRLHAQTTKNKKLRKKHPIPSALVSLLRRLRAGEIPMLDSRGREHPSYRGAASGPTDRVFVCIPETDTLRRDLKKAKVQKETSAGHLDFHSLRGAFAVLLEKNGVGLSSAQKLMRHSDPELTANVYQSLEFSELALALEAVSTTAATLAATVDPPATPDKDAVAKNVTTHGASSGAMGTYEDAPEDSSGASSDVSAGGTHSKSNRATWLFARPSGFEDRGRHQPTLGPVWLCF